MRNLTAKFTAGKALLVVKVRTGKKGHNISVSQRQAGVTTITGCQETAQDEAYATKRFQQLCEETIERGWKPLLRVKQTFDEIPAPPAPVAVKKASKV